MGDSVFGAGADLNSVVASKKESFDVVIRMEFGELFSDEVSVIETARTNMFIDSRKRDKVNLARKLW